MGTLWKTNWEETKQHFEDWWKHTGLVFGSWGPGLATSREHAPEPQPEAPRDHHQRHCDADWIARNTRWKMAHRAWPGDVLPSGWAHVGTLPLAPYLGAAPDYSEHNVWYKERMSSLDDHPPLVFDPNHPEVVQLEGICRETQRLADGNYFVSLPAMLGGIDVLAEVRGTGEMLVELLDNPEGIHKRLVQIQDAYEIAFNRLYDIVKHPDGGMCFGFFMLYGKGKVGLCQCDTGLMISPPMFDEYVVPYLKRQIDFLDHAMFHVDGAGALMHLDSLLKIDELEAIEYTPDPNSPGPADPHWFPTYKKILDHGKSLWVANLKKHEVLPVLDAIGGKGVYISVNYIDEKDGEELARAIEKYR